MKLKKTLFGLIISIGLWQISASTYMLAKAYFSQFLIQQAWQQTLIDNKNHKPWTWADTYPIAEMSVPRLHQKTYILEGSSARNLAFSATHLPESGLPNENKSMIIAGHRDSHFSYLKKVMIGDEISLKTRQNDFLYHVINIEIRNASSQKLTIKAQNELILVTCYPFDAINAGGNLRYVIYLQPKSMEEKILSQL